MVKMEIDSDDVVYGLLLFMVVLAVMVFVTGVLDTVYNVPWAAEDAKRQCIERGFDNYRSFQREVFSRQALGVQCMYENRYRIEEGGVLIDSREE